MLGFPFPDNWEVFFNIFIRSNQPRKLLQLREQFSSIGDDLITPEIFLQGFNLSKFRVDFKRTFSKFDRFLRIALTLESNSESQLIFGRLGVNFQTFLKLATGQI